MKRSLLIVGIMILMIFVCGCIRDNTGPQDQNDITQISNEINGHIIYNGSAISDASVEATAVNGTDHVSTTTDADGAYTLKIKPGTTYNVTATHERLRHTIWPVSSGRKHYDYDISLTATPKSLIEGTGYSMGGPEGYDNSRPLTGYRFILTREDGNDTLTTAIQDDWGYSVEVEPGVMYHIDGYYPNVGFNYRNNSIASDVVVGSNETALIDYVIVMP